MSRVPGSDPEGIEAPLDPFGYGRQAGEGVVSGEEGQRGWEDRGESSSRSVHGTVSPGAIACPPYTASVQSTSSLQERPLPLPVALPSQPER